MAGRSRSYRCRHSIVRHRSFAGGRCSTPKYRVLGSGTVRTGGTVRLAVMTRLMNGDTCRRCVFWKRRGPVVGDCYRDGPMGVTAETDGCASWQSKVLSQKSCLHLAFPDDRAKSLANSLE